MALAAVDRCGDNEVMARSPEPTEKPLRPLDADPRVLDTASCRTFIAVADAGSMTRAARHLRVSQPSVTSAIQRLESELGLALFVRERQGVTLTDEGQQLYSRALHILDFMAETERVVLATQVDARGHFRIGCHVSLGAYVLPSFMAAFHEEAQGVEIELFNASSAEITDAVVARQVHFGLVVNPLPHPDLVIVDLFGDAVDFFVRARPGQAPPQCFTEDLEEARHALRSHRLVFADRVGQSHSIIDMLAAQGLAPTRRLACGDLELVKSLTLGGVGIGLLPRRVALYGGHRSLVRVHRLLPFFPDTICLLYRADQPRTRAATLLKNALVTHGRNLGSADDAYA